MFWILYLFIFIEFVSSTKLAPTLGEQILRRSQNAGTKVEITCFIQDGQKPIVFEWFRNDELILANHHHHKYQIDSDYDTSHLTIANLDQTDAANYSCKVRNDHGFDSQTTNLIVKGLSFFPLLNRIQFRNNVWRLIHYQFLNVFSCFQLFILIFQHLILLPSIVLIKMSYLKYFLLLCCLKFQLIWANSHKLNQFFPNHSQKNGTKFALFCLVQDGQKPFIFEWRFNDQLLKLSSDYRIDSFNDDQSQLTITKLNPKHSGTYSCIARNDFGFDKQSTHLIVTGLRIFIV